MAQFIIWLVRGYQKYISSWTQPSCRYSPTCSNYMIVALKKHGLKGLLMGVAQILRCHPFVEGGYDPVPEYFSLRAHRVSTRSDKKSLEK